MSFALRKKKGKENHSASPLNFELIHDKCRLVYAHAPFTLARMYIRTKMKIMIEGRDNTVYRMTRHMYPTRAALVDRNPRYLDFQSFDNFSKAV